VRAIWIIATNTYREIIRDRILYGIMIFAVLLIGLSLALGELSFDEQARITTSFGLSAIQLSAMVLSIFLGSSLVTKEIEKKTIMTLLVRPVTRMQFLLGKAAGLLLLQVTVMTVLALVLMGIYWGIGVPLQYQFLLAMHGLFIEALVLLGLSIFFSIFATPMMVVAFALSLFLIGHWLESLAYFSRKATGLAAALTGFLGHIIPDLEKFNWRSAVIYADEVAAGTIGWATLYGIAWFALLLVLSSFIFRRRDFA
jgi:Cu-processing system permease protein